MWPQGAVQEKAEEPGWLLVRHAAQRVSLGTCCSARAWLGARTPHLRQHNPTICACDTAAQA